MSHQLPRRDRTAILRFFSRRKTDVHREETTNFLSRDEFENQLQIERARVDRSGHAFSMIEFTFQGTHSDEEIELAEKALIAALGERTRVCDAKGWYGARPAVLLPYTSKVSASSLFSPIDALFQKYYAAASPTPTDAPRLSFVVHGYPEEAAGSKTTNGSAAAASGQLKG